MASNKPNPDWWTKVPKDLELHNEIWFNAIQVLISVESRCGSRVSDIALDQLIRIGLIDWDKKEVSLAMCHEIRFPGLISCFHFLISSFWTYHSTSF